jgi:plasmid stabilization system protein ParE
VADGILEAIETLEYLPHRHPVLRTIEKMEETYRFALKWRYKIIYRIIEDPPEVRVVTIFHSSQDPRELERILG